MSAVGETHSEPDFLVLRPDVAVAVLEDGAVLLDLESKYFFSVNSSGWAIIRLFERGSNLDRVRAQCRAWNRVSENDREAEAFLQRLIKERLIIRDDGNHRPPNTEEPLQCSWSAPTMEKHAKPLQRIMTSAFDPSIPLAE